jgi:hypothetical protein
LSTTSLAGQVLSRTQGKGITDSMLVEEARLRVDKIVEAFEVFVETKLCLDRWCSPSDSSGDPPTY